MQISDAVATAKLPSRFRRSSIDADFPLGGATSTRPATPGRDPTSKRRRDVIIDSLPAAFQQATVFFAIDTAFLVSFFSMGGSEKSRLF